MGATGHFRGEPAGVRRSAARWTAEASAAAAQITPDSTRLFVKGLAELLARTGAEYWQEDEVVVQTKHVNAARADGEGKG